MPCTGVIPNTFIACGEEGQYCSTECWEAAKSKLPDCTCCQRCDHESHPGCPTHAPTKRHSKRT